MNLLDRAWDLIPTPIYRTWRKIRHPSQAWYVHKKNKWVRNVKPGDTICTCWSQHEVVVSVDDYGDAITEDGRSHDLWHCCTEPRDDNSCHYTPEEAAEVMRIFNEGTKDDAN